VPTILKAGLVPAFPWPVERIRRRRVHSAHVRPIGSIAFAHSPVRASGDASRAEWLFFLTLRARIKRSGATSASPSCCVTADLPVALAAYWNAWPNTLVHDDKFYAGSERFTALSNIPRYFTENAWATSGINEPLYRPLLLVTITLDARAYGDWVAGYHLSNIVLHALVCVLLFGFLRQLLRMHHGPTPTDSPAALAVALIFAVHPVYTEVVNSVFNRSEMLVALVGLTGLAWFCGA
jgi:hypothetical protein